MNATTKIMNKLEEIFAPMDAKVLESSKQWAKERTKAMYAFKKSEEYKEAMNRSHWEAYEKLFAIAGGKTWYNVFYGRDEESIENFVTKNCAKIAKNRNLKISQKLQKAGITDVISEEISHTDDGFNGFFIINTDKGQKRVTIETVYAGGYNIQCLHLRVLVKVK